MAISGPQALSSLDEALRDIRREEDDISKRLARSSERVSKFRESEAELFRQLAMIRLDPATQKDLTDRISQAEIRARIALKKHADTLQSTEEALKTVDGEIASLATERATALAEVDRQQAELKALSARIATAIAQDPAYAQRREAAERLRKVASESLSKTTQAEADREQKGRPYRDDPLFMYLWQRGFGTSAYKAGNLTRWLDGLVASHIGYSKARPNFAMLNDIPLRLREHAERQEQLAETAEDELDALEEAAIDAAGGKPIREALSAAQARIATIDARVVELEDKRDDGAQALRTLAQGSDPDFEQALAALAQGLGREDLQSLLAEARRTHTAQDDTIISQIDDLRARIREEDNETREHKERLKTLAARRRELEDIQYEFKKARFDDPRSTFREDRLVGDLLTDFLRGGITAASYWDQWRRSQNWQAGTSDWGGGFGLPRNGRSPWGWPDEGPPNSGGSGGGFSWPGGDGGFNWPSGGSGSSHSSRPRSGSGSGGAWGRPSGGSSGGFSRPRQGSSGNRRNSDFKTGGGF